MSLKKHIQIARRNNYIAPKLHGWLANNDGVKIADEALRQRVMDMLTPSGGDRSGAFHPSQLYQCKRAQLFGYFNVRTLKTYDPTLQNLFNDGHFRHLRWQIMLMSAGILTDVEVPVSAPEYRLTGSMDGVNADEDWMFELKGTSQFRQIQQRGALPAHIKQINAYLMASGLERCILVYECKSSQQWAEIEVKRDQKIINELKAILTELNEAVDGGQLPEVLNECKNQEGQYNHCPYASVCVGFSTTEQVIASVQVRPRRARARGLAR